MTEHRSSWRVRVSRAVVIAGLVGVLPFARALSAEQLPDNFPFLNASGTAATYGTTGFVDLTNPFHVTQGANGRSCESCHLPQAGWSVRPVDVELSFLLTRGRGPLWRGGVRPISTTGLRRRCATS